jgi:hypothetical protein
MQILTFLMGHAIAQVVSRWHPTSAARVRARVCSCGIVVDKVALGQVFSEYFGFPCQSSFHQLLHNHDHLSSGAGTIDQLVADVPSGLKSHLTKNNNKKIFPNARIVHKTGFDDAFLHYLKARS